MCLLEYARHVLRGSSGIDHLYILEGKVKEKRARGRPRLTWIDDIVEWTVIDTCDKIKSTSEDSIRCAWAKFRELCPILTLRGASLKAKGRIYSACVRSVMIYGSETWPMKVEDKQRLERTENMMVRWMCGASVRDRIRTEELRGRLAIEGIADIVRRGRLRWFGHVERKTEEDWVSTVRKLDVAGSRGPGRGKKTWSQVVTEDLELMGLRREEALDRDAWRRSIYGRPVQPVQARKKRR